MKCPRCSSSFLRTILTQKGIEIDRCPACRGIWLDKGEVYRFAAQPIQLQFEIDQARKQAKPSSLLNPKTGRPMLQIRLGGRGVGFFECPTTMGMWVDGSEVGKLEAAIGTGVSFGEDEKVAAEYLAQDKAASLRPSRSHSVPLPPLPNLGIRSIGVLFFLYTLLSFGLVVFGGGLGLPVAVSLGAGLFFFVFSFLISPFVMDVMLRWTQNLRWVGLEDLPGPISSGLQKICQAERLKIPRLGLIEDGNPNAFSYGHVPNDARLVLTRGILNLLDEEEALAVIAHEVGHAKHWDMLIMTTAQLVPLIFHSIYRALAESHWENSKKKGSTAAVRLAGMAVAYLIYFVSLYLVLFLSRAREYFADRFAGEVTGKPGALASALVKIGYGMAGRDLSQRPPEEAKRTANLGAVGALGLFDPKAAQALVIDSARISSGGRPMGGAIDREALKQAMRWDRWNPWAKYYELQSTHPLIAHRLQALGQQALALGQEPFIFFDLVRPESYWDEFLMDLFIFWAPMIFGLTALGLGSILAGGFAVVSAASGLAGLFLAGLGLGMFAQIKFEYPVDHFPEMSITSALKQVKVSAIRPVPCTLKGKIVGRGIPGLVWSEDFILQDETGILFLDYRQPLAIWEFFFGLRVGAQLQGKNVAVTGWYRRSPVPYLEILTLTDEDKAHRSYGRLAKRIASVLLLVLGLALAFGSFLL